MNAAPLILALPSKGRLEEAAIGWLADAGLAVERGASGRDYVGRIPALAGVEVWFLSAAEIAMALDQGRAHLGVTGEDLIREHSGEPGASIALLKALGFGQADVVVAVPRAWIDVATMADLDDVCQAFVARRHRRLRVATKYMKLSRAFFAEMGVRDYRIVESLGATEGAPAAGTAEAIVDITSSGATLRANNLKVLNDGLILKSQAQLAAGLRAPWGETQRAAARLLFDRIEARSRAGRFMQVSASGIDAEKIDGARLESVYGCAGIVLTSEAAERTGIVLQCPVPAVHDVSIHLRKADAAHVTVARADYIFSHGGELYDHLLKRLGAS
jgi:ATP phosphoribosyltransferase